MKKQLPGFELYGFDLANSKDSTAYLVIDNNIRQWHPATGEWLPCQVTIGQCRRGTITDKCIITRMA